MIDSPRIMANKPVDGYKSKPIHQAEVFFKTQFPHATSRTLSQEQNKHLQGVLWEIFRFDRDVRNRALAGLCLRCYVSQRILIACKTIHRIYNASAENLFTYIDILPFVLNDDGKALVIVDTEGKTQHILNDRTTEAIVKGTELFSVEILRKFNPHLNSSQNLDNWTTTLTRQNENIRSFLWEHGLATPSDWGLLCKDFPRSLSALFITGDSEIVKAFQVVYQRDRLKLGQKGRCSEPTPTQIKEMLHILQQKNIVLSPKDLISHLKRIAEILRQDWRYKKTGNPKTVPTEVYNHSTDDYIANPKLPLHTDRDPEDIELEDLQQHCETLFESILYQTIAEVIQERVEDLKKSRGYKNFAHRFPEGLRLYYQESMTLNEIGKLWEIGWSKARRIFQLENFLEIVQYRTEEKFLENLLQTLNQSQSTRISHDPDDLQNIAAEIREFALNKAFKEAKAELLGKRKKRKTSLAAQIIRIYLQNSSYAA